MSQWDLSSENQHDKQTYSQKAKQKFSVKSLLIPNELTKLRKSVSEGQSIQRIKNRHLKNFGAMHGLSYVYQAKLQ